MGSKISQIFRPEKPYVAMADAFNVALQMCGINDLHALNKEYKTNTPERYIWLKVEETYYYIGMFTIIPESWNSCTIADNRKTTDFKNMESCTSDELYDSVMMAADLLKSPPDDPKREPMIVFTDKRFNVEQPCLLKYSKAHGVFDRINAKRK